VKINRARRKVAGSHTNAMLLLSTTDEDFMFESRRLFM